MRAVLPLVLTLFGCSKSPVQRPPADSTGPPALPAVSPAGSSNRELVQPAVLPARLRAACDTAAGLVHEALALEPKREDGSFFDSFKAVQRVGCRLSAEGSFATLRDSAGPVEAVEKAFTRRGWRPDLRYMADGPDGSDVGLRRLDQLCLVVGRWDGGDDSDTTSAPPTEEQNRYQAIVECARDVPSNADAGVPDSIWRIASDAGLDSVYAIWVGMQYPPYLDGDFDGDDVKDAAVLVEHRATGKLGVAIVHRGTRRVSILGAGSGSAGPSDLSWIDRWDLYHKGVTFSLTIQDQPSIQLGADALWVGRQDSVSAFYIWTGGRYVWEAHPRTAGRRAGAFIGTSIRR
ncbi:MAG: hypothetical protein ACJ8DJ_15430 [Gemmatimonadales bacterium]